MSLSIGHHIHHVIVSHRDALRLRAINRDLSSNHHSASIVVVLLLPVGQRILFKCLSHFFDRAGSGSRLFHFFLSVVVADLNGLQFDLLMQGRVRIRFSFVRRLFLKFLLLLLWDLILPFVGRLSFLVLVVIVGLLDAESLVVVGIFTWNL